MQPQPDAEVSPEAAYAAALNRAQSTQHALILSEAQVLELRRELARTTEKLQDEVDSFRHRYELARDRASRFRRRLELRDQEERDREDQEEGEGDGTEGDTAAEAVREAVQPPDFSD